MLLPPFIALIVREDEARLHPGGDALLVSAGLAGSPVGEAHVTLVVARPALVLGRLEYFQCLDVTNPCLCLGWAGLD